MCEHTCVQPAECPHACSQSVCALCVSACEPRGALHSRVCSCVSACLCLRISMLSLCIHSGVCVLCVYTSMFQYVQRGVYRGVSVHIHICTHSCVALCVSECVKGQHTGFSWRLGLTGCQAVSIVNQIFSPSTPRSPGGRVPAAREPDFPTAGQLRAPFLAQKKCAALGGLPPGGFVSGFDLVPGSSRAVIPKHGAGHWCSGPELGGQGKTRLSPAGP